MWVNIADRLKRQVAKLFTLKYTNANWLIVTLVTSLGVPSASLSPDLPQAACTAAKKAALSNGVTPDLLWNRAYWLPML